MKKLYIALGIAATVYSCKVNTPVSKTDLVLAEKAKTDIYTLASDDFEGRGIGTPGADKAAAYIFDRFEQMGLSPKGTNSYYQSFTFIPQGHGQIHQVGDSLKMGMSVSKEIQGKNVIAMIDNGAPYTIVIGAHYDHLGYGDENSLWTGERAIHNGADDNASGVSAMLELAGLLVKKNTNTIKYNYVFIAFSGEEKGLWGSNYFSKNPTLDLTKIDIMLNMDMVGRMNAERALSISGTGTSPKLEKYLTYCNTSNFKLLFDPSGIGPSDHSSFYNVGVPVLHFFTGQHSDYHKPTDDADKINFQGLQEVVSYMYSLIIVLNENDKLEFTKTKEPAQQNTSFKVTLGIMPDYMFSGTGLRVDGVREERPAAKAGIKQGDVIVKMGDNAIPDMQAYMESLGKFSEGQTIPVEIIRDGNKMVVQVTFK